MNEAYNPQHFWEQRLRKRFSLRGVGHIGFSDAYNGWLYRRKRRCINSCLAKVPLQGKSVLDVGCGTGWFVDWYLRHKADVCGIDITNISVENLRKQYPCEFHTQDITAPDYQLYSSKFDIVNMWDVVYHIVDPMCFSQAFDNIASSLKDEGLLLFTDWFGAASDVRIADHVQARCLDTYQRILPEKGFELVELRPLYHYLNKPHFGERDNRLGWLYFAMDNCFRRISSDNLSLGLWRYRRPDAKPTPIVARQRQVVRS